MELFGGDGAHGDGKWAHCDLCCSQGRRYPSHNRWGDCAAVQCKHLTPTRLPQEVFKHSEFMMGYETGEIMKLTRHSLERRWKQHFCTRHMVCEPSIRQWILQLLPSIPKSLGRSCEQFLCGMSAVQSALGGCPGQHFPPQAGRDTQCSCTCVPSCVRITAGRVNRLCLCSVCSLWCRYSWPRRVFACMPFFEDTGRINTPQTVQGTEMLLDFYPPPVRMIGFTPLLWLCPEGCNKWRKKSTLGMYLAYFSITMCTS